MAVGDLITADGQFELNGLLLGPSTNYEIQAVQGLDLPALRTSDVSRPQDHGIFRGVDLLEPRIIEVTLDVGPPAGASSAGWTAALFDAAKTALDLATQPTTTLTGFATPEVPLVMRLPGQGKRLVNVRPRKRAWTYDVDWTSLLGTVDLQLIASDPRIYDLTVQTATATVAVATGGLSTVLTTVLTTSGTTVSGAVLVTNTGTFACRPTITITGPSSGALAGFTITNLTQGLSLGFPNLTLASGDQLVIDLDARSVVLNGAASRRGSLAGGSTWFEIPAGTAQSLVLTGSDASGTSSMTVTYRSAWL